ncbi:MAG: exo-beta-N-acetylmuramidase NamZ domain-containing protein, partial [Bacteroidota bacterium]|nr:exo-beta-N-acetylmuramidase NamZ domain-containing protein [Bacteroidota bacterium]
MRFSYIKNTVLLFVLVLVACGNNANPNNQNTPTVGANQLERYLPLLKNKKVGVIANQTSVIFDNKSQKKTKRHLVDSLLDRGISIQKVFAPEHGYRGQADAGEYVKNGVDIKTGLQIVSLYGSNRKPSPEVLKDLEVIL